jgi:ubiquinol-cytochrome c reductase iron-sulfur subunit
MQALLEQLMRSYPTDLTLTQSYLFLQEKIGAFEQEKNPPRIRIISPADWESRGIEIGEEEETVNLVGMVEDESGIGSVMVNGKPVYWTSQGQFSTTVALPEPINHFVIEATDTKGNKATLRLALSASKGSTAALDTANAANYYALLIGVSQQKDTRISAIVSAADDVRRLRKTLLENYQFSEDRIRTLQNPTRASLLNELEAISLNMGANDNLLVFYAGHGTYIASGVVEQGLNLLQYADKSGAVRASSFHFTDLESRMANHEVNTGRRRFLTTTTAVVGAIGAGFAAVPFVTSFKPSARAQTAGAPVTVNISKIDNEPGMRIIQQWRGKPVWVFKRTPEQLATLKTLDGNLRDPKSDNIDQTPAFAKNEARTIKGKENIAVIVGICTHLGCSPSYVPEMLPQPFDADWKGGFYCPCHQSRFDLAGRVYQGVPAPSNLEIPPYHYSDDSTIVIGVAPEGAV